VEIIPYFLLRAGTQTIFLLPQSFTNMPQKHMSARSPYSWHLSPSRSTAFAAAMHFSIGSRGLSQVPFSSIFYHWNIGISIPTTTTTNPGATKTKESCQRGHKLPPYSMLDYGSGWSAYAGDNGGEGMMEDTVEANGFAAEHSCLNNNIYTNKSQGLFLWKTMMMVQPIAME
jgi:hypothetical protein